MRTLKKCHVLVALLACACVYAHASVVSIQVIQHDSVDKNLHSTSFLIEDTLMDYFFNAGCIASSMPATISPDSKSDYKKEKQALLGAEEGFCNYLIMVYADYDTSESRNPTADLLSNIATVSWKVIDVRDGETVSSGRKKPPVQQSSKDVVTFIRELAVTIAAAIR